MNDTEFSDKIDKLFSIKKRNKTNNSEFNTPTDIIFDVTIKNNHSGRGDFASRDRYKGLAFQSLKDVIKKYE